MVGESCDDSCAGLSHTGRKVWSSFAILELIGHFYCVTVIKHSMSLRRMKSYTRTSRWKWYVSVTRERSEIRDYVESLKWNEEKELSYERNDSVEFLKLKWNE